MADSLTALMDRIDARADELVALTQDLVRIPTVNPPGDGYRACAEFLGDRLGRRGFAVEYVRGAGSPGDSDRYPRTNVIARREGHRPGRCVHFNGHIDVVEAGRGWSADPFSAEVRDGRIYGRGTCDMKGGLAAAIIAVETLVESGLPLPGALEISGTVDEESGGYGGVAYLAERGWFRPGRVDHVIIPEPLNVDRVCIGHRGVWWAELETKGRIAHGSMPFLGESAVRHMGAVLERFEHELLPALAARRTAMPVVPAGARESSCNINSIHGGQPEEHAGLPTPCVADSCRIVIDRRFLIEEPLPGVKQEVRAILERLAQSRSGFRYELRDLFEVLPAMADPDGPVVQATLAAVREVLGREPEIVCSPGTYDQKHIERIGKLKDCIAYGPGILDLAHQPDEFVAIEDLVASAKVMARAAHALLNRGA
ncbi:MAG TPA: acetylornithine deacetylase/succinyl-diaminopimelate desuccinylase family protein [Steroidobacteraceae bacterium]|nr:acetylornithine deacetylase/succinyl-diaminopimelate desuccinylase family protein [Steroidobacteraceae bacterium]